MSGVYWNLLDKAEKYREMVESVNSIIIRLATDGTITFMNRYAQEFFGFEGEEVLEKNIVGTLLPATGSRGQDLAAMMRDIPKHPDRYVHNVNENIKKNGERVWVSWTNRVVLDRAGRVIEILAVGNDITPLKKAHEELRKARDDLERRVEERTAELRRKRRTWRNPSRSLTLAAGSGT